jgi:hypothetical protein
MNFDSSLWIELIESNPIIPTAIARLINPLKHLQEICIKQYWLCPLKQEIV